MLFKRYAVKCMAFDDITGNIISGIQAEEMEKYKGKPQKGYGPFPYKNTADISQIL